MSDQDIPNDNDPQDGDTPMSDEAQADAAAKAAEAAEAADAANDDGAPVSASLEEENTALKDRLLRTLADLENTRRRAEKERSEASLYGITKFARDMLSVADNLRRAIDAVPAETRETDEAVQNLLSGVELTERELLAGLEKNGVKPVFPKGEKFDAHFHQAMAEVPGSGQPSGTVVDVVQTGYLIGERLLRPAMVTVAKGGDGDNGGPGSTVDTTA